MRKRSPSDIVSSRFDVKEWTAFAEEVPSVDRVRPARCPYCGSGSRPTGQRLVIHGHSTRTRLLYGPLTATGQPAQIEVVVRRYRCTACSRCMTVGPRGVLTRMQYSGGAIGMALAMWALTETAVRQVRKAICPTGVHVDAPHGWSTLYRWARRADRLFDVPCEGGVESAEAARRRAKEVATVLMGRAPDGCRGSPRTTRASRGGLLGRA